MVDNSKHLPSSDVFTYCNARLTRFLPTFLDIAISEIKAYDVSEDDVAYYSHAIQYNLQGGKLIRGTLVVSTTRSILGDEMTEHHWHQALVLGWCVELLQTAFLVADDIMDKSVMRRSSVCCIIHKQFKDSTHLVSLMNMFTQVSMITILGQHMDTYDALHASLFDTPTVATSLYYRICKNKTSYYTFFLPIKLGMIISDIDQANINFSKLESVSSLLGHLFQAQDDYLDCYSDPSCSGKEGTDIQTRKCTWLLATAIHVGSKLQLQQIKENIGRDDPTKVDAVKRIYNDLKLPRLFKVYTQDLKCNIQSQINDIKHKGMSKKQSVDLINRTGLCIAMVTGNDYKQEEIMCIDNH
ncbi:Farnesyl diphosphate synthase [Babesia sp. Xinjiang]|uniref:Farnesyl diphosphate synthase n=1 Tax=Babesia sp. Xinjiang TaxID=462227 RepID=UPI000A2542FB|nr:Farnesyl diphosphate synthase [Babesia sp. Xinjiang]ORM40443.1 Farnesyl diphosphate synthase [Babesia sp. Xinjiang]